MHSIHSIHFIATPAPAYRQLWHFADSFAVKK